MQDIMCAACQCFVVCEEDGHLCIECFKARVAGFTLFEVSPVFPATRPRLICVPEGASYIDIVAASGYVKSRSEARRMIEGGAISRKGIKQALASESAPGLHRIGKNGFFDVIWAGYWRVTS